MSLESVMASYHLNLCCPFILLPSIFSSIRVTAVCIRWPKYWSFSTSPSNEYSGFISFWIDWFDMLAVQGTLKSLLQYHNLKESLLWHPTFIMVQLSHLNITTGKTIALTVYIFDGKVIPLLFNTQSRFVQLPWWLSW